MTNELSILKDIYFLLTIISSALAVLILVVFIGSMFLMKKLAKKMMQDKQGKLLSLLFEKNRTEQIIDICEKILKEKPNNALALWYLAKTYYLREEFMRTRDYLERLKKVNPESENGYAKAYWSNIDDGLERKQKDVKA